MGVINKTEDLLSKCKERERSYAYRMLLNFKTLVTYF